MNGHKIILDNNVPDLKFQFSGVKIHAGDMYAAPGDIVTFFIDKEDNDFRYSLVAYENTQPHLDVIFNELRPGSFTFWFAMPPVDITIKSKSLIDNATIKEETIMGPETNQKHVDTFEIPDELAQELSKLLTKQTIKERLLIQLLNDPEKYNQVEDMLVPITARIEAIKLKITNSYVPPHYQFAKYIWNYDGYEVAGNKVDVFEIV